MQQMHVTLPPDVEPVLVVLLLGVTTDYSVFFASGMRNRLAEGMSKVQAARLTTAEFAPIILAAGLLVAAGTASLAVAPMQLIRAFGPALAVTVLTAMVVSLTLAPALIAIFGSALFWPGPGWFRKAQEGAPPGGPSSGGGRAAVACAPIVLAGARDSGEVRGAQAGRAAHRGGMRLGAAWRGSERDAHAAWRAAGHRASCGHASRSVPKRPPPGGLPRVSCRRPRS